MSYISVCVLYICIPLLFCSVERCCLCNWTAKDVGAECQTHAICGRPLSYRLSARVTAVFKGGSAENFQMADIDMRHVLIVVSALNYVCSRG